MLPEKVTPVENEDRAREVSADLGLLLVPKLNCMANLNNGGIGRTVLHTLLTSAMTLARKNQFQIDC